MSKLYPDAPGSFIWFVIWFICTMYYSTYLFSYIILSWVSSIKTISVVRLSFSIVSLINKKLYMTIKIKSVPAVIRNSNILCVCNGFDLTMEKWSKIIPEQNSKQLNVVNVLVGILRHRTMNLTWITYRRIQIDCRVVVLNTFAGIVLEPVYDLSRMY